MSDEELRDLERRAGEGDVRALASLRRRRAALLQDWTGRPLAAERPLTEIGRYTVALVPIEPGRFAACVDAGRDWYPRPTAEIFHEPDLARAIRRGVRWVVVDLSTLRMIQSSTLAALIRVAERFQREGGSLVLVGVTPMVQVVLDLLGLNVFFEVRETREAALLALLERDP